MQRRFKQYERDIRTGDIQPEEKTHDLALEDSSVVVFCDSDINHNTDIIRNFPTSHKKF